VPFECEPSKISGRHLANDQKLTKIDESIIGDHAKLTADDECYFWREYTSGRDYRFGPANDLISNLKKKRSQSSSGAIWHKDRVIRECSIFFSRAVNMKWLEEATLVPVPGSKTKEHPDFDDRMSRICRGIRPQPALDVRELVIQSESTDAAHEASDKPRPTVEELLRIYRIDESLAVKPTAIAIFDDVLTAGVHYRAMHTILSKRFPRVPIVGFFVARRIFPNPFEALKDED
jgi:hypothetical protein